MQNILQNVMYLRQTYPHLSIAAKYNTHIEEKRVSLAKHVYMHKQGSFVCVFLPLTLIMPESVGYFPFFIVIVIKHLNINQRGAL